jgi:hypothetical protein
MTGRSAHNVNARSYDRAYQQLLVDQLTAGDTSLRPAGAKGDYGFAAGGQAPWDRLGELPRITRGRRAVRG